MFISFSDIPGHQNLFLDYLYEFEQVEKYYKINFRNFDTYPELFEKIARKDPALREKVSQIIYKQYANKQKSTKTNENILSLKEKNTVVIFTGQQLGIAGGPLYTFYKTITAIKLAEEMNEEYDAYNFVPVFWLAGDDHDFDEISQLNLISTENRLQTIKYGTTEEENPNYGSVGNLTLDEFIHPFFDKMKNTLNKTEFTDTVFDFLNSTFSEGKSLKNAFLDMMYSMFDKFGLVIFDPQDAEVKKLLQPVFFRELESFREHSTKLISVSADLEEHYHAQVKVNPINIFIDYHEGRYAVEPADDNQFRLKRKRVKFSREELYTLLDEHPEKFSPNVLLRPICQDYLFPTAFYIGGPGEINYFAQIAPLYEFYNLQKPILYPRISATILESNIQRVLEKYSLSINELFIKQEAITDILVSQVADLSVDKHFHELGDMLKEKMEKIKEGIEKIDPTTANGAEKYLEKMLNYVDELQEKTFEAQKKKHNIALKQAEKAITHLIPKGNLQERELNYFYYANKYGMDFINILYDTIRLGTFEHQIVEL